MITIFSRTLLTVFLVAALTVSSAVVVAQDFSLSSSSIAAGSGYSEAGSFTLDGTITHDAGNTISGGSFEVNAGFLAGVNSNPFLLGDVNRDGFVNLLDVAPFVDLIVNFEFQAEGDINQDGLVNILDIAPFIDIIAS